MHRYFFLLLLLTALFSLAVPVHARQHAGFSGLAASADSASTAGTNPAGITRFNSKASQFELLTIYSESTWEGKLGDGPTFESDDSSTTIVPTGYMIRPINDQLSFGFTVLGAGFSDDLGDWPGRYFISSYDSINISAFPSLAYRVNDSFSIAGSIAITYATFDQERAVANLFDPGAADGMATLETDGFDVGFGLSFLHEITNRTRWGVIYNSGSDPELEGKVKFKGLGPNTEAVLDKAGFIGAKVKVKSKTPQSVLAGIYHEFSNNHAITADIVWADFSEFKLSELYFDGQAMAENEASYEDIYAISVGYSWPLAERWMLGVSALYVDDMIKDDDRTATFRLDSMWSAGMAAEWQWTDTRAVQAALSYMSIGDAPVTTPPIMGIGSMSGEYTSRDVWLLRLGVTFGAF